MVTCKEIIESIEITVHVDGTSIIIRTVDTFAANLVMTVLVNILYLVLQSP